MSFNSNEEDTFRSNLLLSMMNIEIDRSANQTPNNEPINEKVFMLKLLELLTKSNMCMRFLVSRMVD